MMDFTPADLDSRFKHWLALGITSYCKMSSYTGLGLRLSTTLRNLWSWEKVFFQISSTETLWKNIQTYGEEGTTLLRIFTNACKDNSKRKLISRIYSALQLNRGLSTTYIKARQEKEVNVQLSEHDWLNICRTQSTTSSSDLWREFNNSKH